MADPPASDSSSWLPPFESRNPRAIIDDWYKSLYIDRSSSPPLGQPSSSVPQDLGTSESADGGSGVSMQNAFDDHSITYVGGSCNCCHHLHQRKSSTSGTQVQMTRWQAAAAVAPQKPRDIGPPRCQAAVTSGAQIQTIRRWKTSQDGTSHIAKLKGTSKMIWTDFEKTADIFALPAYSLSLNPAHNKEEMTASHAWVKASRSPSNFLALLISFQLFDNDTGELRWFCIPFGHGVVLALIEHVLTALKYFWSIAFGERGWQKCLQNTIAVISTVAVFHDVTSSKEETTVALVEEQREWESRNLWFGVAKGTREGDFESAATFKGKIEAEKMVESAGGTTWELKHFKHVEHDLVCKRLGKLFKANPPTEDGYVYLGSGPRSES
ncbi:hypothetical protein EDD22DRAFT_1029234 [Suillus occidentalis]|nr:hypothetical protein EDD22DRAFT_1029234 [Suillus occidentalis]